MEMQGESKSNEKRISKGRGAKTGQSAVCLKRDGTWSRTQTKVLSLSG